MRLAYALGAALVFAALVAAPRGGFAQAGSQVTIDLCQPIVRRSDLDREPIVNTPEQTARFLESEIQRAMAPPGGMLMAGSPVYHSGLHEAPPESQTE